MSIVILSEFVLIVLATNLFNHFSLVPIILNSLFFIPGQLTGKYKPK